MRFSPSVIGLLHCHFNSGPDAKIIKLTTYKSDTQIVIALKAGAQGYLLKNALHEKSLDTIRAAHGARRKFHLRLP
jgi:DNA-binding NarL/FixJ family response regulator